MNLTEVTTRTLAGFAKALVPTFEKSRLLEDMSASHKKLRDIEPFFNTSGREFAAYITKNMPALEGVLRNEYPGYRGNAIQSIHEVIKLRIKEEADLVEYIDNIYSRVFLRDAVDYRKLMMLRYAATFGFFTDYCRKLMLVVCDGMVGDRDISSPVDREDREFVLDSTNMNCFARILSALSSPVKDIRDAFDELNKIQYDPDNHDIMMRTNGIKLDPMGFGYLPVVGSIVYFMGRQWNAFLAMKQEENQDEIAKLQVKLLVLRRKVEGGGEGEDLDKLKRQIDYYNNRLNKLNAKLSRLVQED